MSRPELSEGIAGVAPLERIGIFGGTFDPPHNAHLAVAAEVRSALGLDRVVFVVAGEPWQKVSTRAVTPARDRVELVRALVGERAGFSVDTSEVDREGPSYTADTVAALQRPHRQLYLILGSDAAAGLPTWERVDEVREAVTPVLVQRPGMGEPTLPAGWQWERVEVPRLDISSSDLRLRISVGRPVEGLMPAGVMSRIRHLGLYGDDREG